MECSCPHFADGFDCKHIWATLVEIDDCLGLGEVGNAHHYVSPSTARRNTRSDKKGSVAASRKSKPSKAKKQPPKAPQWQTLLTAIERQSPFGPTSFDASITPVRVWFVINVSQSMQRKQLVIDCRQQQIKQNGEWGVVKPLKISRKASQSVPEELQGLAEKLHEFDASDDDYGYDAYDRYNSYYYRPTFRESDFVALESDAQQLLVPQLVQSRRLLWYLDDGHPLEPFQPLSGDDGSPWSLRLQLIPANDNANGGKPDDLLLQGRIVRDGESRPLGDIVLSLDEFLIFQDRICRAEASANSTWCEALREQGDLRIPKQDAPEFLKQFYTLPNHPPLELPGSFGVTVDHQVAPTPVLRLTHTSVDRFTRKKPELQAAVYFKYDNHLLEADSAASEVYDPDTQRVIVRDLDAERQASGCLDEMPLIRLGRKGHYRAREDQLLNLTEKLNSRGWGVEIEGRPVRSAGAFKLNVTSGIDWFDLDGSIDFEGLTLTVPELLKSLQQNERFITLSDGSQGMLPDHVLKRLQSLADFAGSNAKTTGLRFQRSQAALLDALLDEKDHFTADAPFRRWRKDLQSLSGVSPKQAPKAFQGELRPYQEEGLGWLTFLQKFSFGGCLADDMGLGKTIQVLALLDRWRTRRRKADEPRRPSLIVVPRSLVFNWVEESARFTPQLKVCNYTTRERHALRERFDEFDVVVTTYGTLRKDIRLLKDISFDYAILDEAQAVKNSKSLSAKACRLIQARHRLAMTGTPVENHMGELWSLFDFLNPGMLGRAQRFQTLTKRVADEPQVLQAVSRAVGPFLLRRTKQQVLKDLPEKTEQTIHCTLSNEERRYYNELRDHYRALLTSKIQEPGGLKQAKIHVLEALLRLRQAACHPGLIDRTRVQRRQCQDRYTAATTPRGLLRRPQGTRLFAVHVTPEDRSHPPG